MGNKVAMRLRGHLGLSWSRRPSQLGILELFSRMIQHPDKFALARLVIPALRDAINQEILAAQQMHIAHATRTVRDSFMQDAKYDQQEADDPLYVAEKRALLDAEVHRAGVWLDRDVAFGTASRQEIEEWWVQRPQGQYKR